MKKILILALLFMGCDYAPTEHTHEHDHDHTHDGVCTWVGVGENIGGEDGYYPYENGCFTNLTQTQCGGNFVRDFVSDIMGENEYFSQFNDYHWLDMTCEEYCAATTNTCTIIEETPEIE